MADDDDGEAEVLGRLRALLGFLEGEKPGSAAAVVLGAVERGWLAKRDWEAVRTCLDADADSQ